MSEARKIVKDEDDRITAGQKFAKRWAQMAEDAKARNMMPGFDLARTQVVVDQTRKLTTKSGGEETVVAWEFLIKAEPGVLAPRGGNDLSPFETMRTWLASMLEIEAALIDLTLHPSRMDEESGETHALINHGLVTLSVSFPLGKAVRHPGPSGAFTDSKGVRWGYAGRDLRGQSVHRRHYVPGQAGGGNRVGVTGMGKSVVTQITAYNDLLLGILPIIHDAGKNAMDFMDFYGIIPVGHTVEHREVIRESLWAEMKRRQVWINTRTVRSGKSSTCT